MAKLKIKSETLNKLINEAVIKEADFQALVKQAKEISNKLAKADLDAKTQKELKTALAHINSVLDRA
jgi:hypothetical protein